MSFSALPKGFSRLFRWVFPLLFLLQVQANPVCGQVLIALVFGDQLNTDKIQFGLTVGGNFSTLSGDVDASFDRGLNLGLFFNFKLGERWYFHPAAIPKSPMGARRLSPYALGDATLDSLFSGGEVERRLNYISVPLLMRYEWPLGLGLESGPQFSLRTNAEDQFQRKLPDGEELDLTRSLRDRTNWFEFGWVFGSYYRMGKNKQGVALNLRYTLGLTQVFKFTDATYPRQKNRLIQLLVGIPIGQAGEANKELEGVLEDAP